MAYMMVTICNFQGVPSPKSLRNMIDVMIAVYRGFNSTSARKLLLEHSASFKATSKRSLYFTFRSGSNQERYKGVKVTEK